MPKRSEEIGFNSVISGIKKRRETQPVQVNAMLGGLENLNIGNSKGFKESEYPIQKINISLIQERKKGNEFSITETGIESLAESISSVGLIDPIQVVGENVNNEVEKKYYVIAGHRRLKAFQLLNKENPNETKYKSIPAIVYIITDDPNLVGISKEHITITKEIEEQIYLDSNLESRQLSYSEVAKYINKIVDRIEKEQNYKADLIRKRTDGKTYNSKEINIPNEIVKILSDYNYSGWSEITIRRFLDIRNLANYDKQAYKLLQEIISKNDNPKPVNSVYKECSEKIKFIKLLDAPQDSKRKFTKKEKNLQNEWKKLLEEEKKQNFEELFSEWGSKNNKKSKSHDKCKSSIYAKKTLDYFTKEKNNLSEKELDEIRKTISELTKLLN